MPATQTETRVTCPHCHTEQAVTAAWMPVKVCQTLGCGREIPVPQTIPCHPQVTEMLGTWLAQCPHCHWRAPLHRTREDATADLTDHVVVV